jgi:hypothetical protein
MSFFEQISGLAGENLASAALRYIIDRSPDMRKCLIDVISDASPLGPLYSNQRFASCTEAPTKNAVDGNGRLDLLIETDNAVIGIENKFDASFNEGQPKKYFKHLSDLAQKISGIYQQECRAILVVLAPESRVVDDAFRQRSVMDLDPSLHQHVTLISWQELLKRMELARPADLVATFLLEQLRQFYLSSTGSLQRLPSIFANLRRRPTNSNLSDQTNFVRWLWHLFVNQQVIPTGIRINSSLGNYVGYTSTRSAGDPDSLLVWYGFYSSKLIDQLKDQAEETSELVLMTTFPVDFPSEFKKINGPIKWSKPYRHFWIIKFEPRWMDPQDWLTRLKPLHTEIDRQIGRLDNPPDP